MVEPVFHFSDIVAKRGVAISLFREHAGRTNDINTIEYATFGCDTVEVENGLKPTQKGTVHDLAS